MSFDRAELLAAGAAGAEGDADHFVVVADHFLSLGDPLAALTALDRAYGLRPDDPTIAEPRKALLDAQTVVEHGLVFRYVPAGSFLMGSTTGDPDEQPVHAVLLPDYWIADVPCTWTRYCALMGWSEPPEGMPPQFDESDDEESDESDDFNEARLYLHNANRLRMYYCDLDESESISDFDKKPMVAVDVRQAEALGERLSSPTVRYGLPSEAEWEKAARGGLIGQPYPWGRAMPDPSRCDCDHFGRWEIADPRTLPSNGYGVHGMSGGVWEWTCTIYDAHAYRLHEPPPDPATLAEDVELRHVLRGGSWADAAASVTVSFRHALVGVRGPLGWGDAFNPNVGFRLIRRVLG